MNGPLISLLREGDKKPSFVGCLQGAIVLGLYRPFLRPCRLYTFASRYCYYQGFPDGANGKELACQCRRYKRETGLIPVSGRSPGEGHSNLLQDSCLKNPMDRGAWRDTAHRVSKSWTWMNSLSTASHSHCYYHFTKWGITIWRYYVPCTGRWEEM